MLKPSPAVRILVVDDLEGFRRFVRATLKARPEWQVVAEASDGLEAAQKAEELKPDLILLDIGLPTLNGIEAAERISALAPDATILFVTQVNDADVVAAALSNGAKGYILKGNANRELLPAVEAVLLGRRFVGLGVTGPGKPASHSSCALLTSALGELLFLLTKTGSKIAFLMRDSLEVRLGSQGF